MYIATIYTFEQIIMIEGPIFLLFYLFIKIFKTTTKMKIRTHYLLQENDIKQWCIINNKTKQCNKTKNYEHQKGALLMYLT